MLVVVVLVVVVGTRETEGKRGREMTRTRCCHRRIVGAKERGGGAGRRVIVIIIGRRKGRRGQDLVVVRWERTMEREGEGGRGREGGRRVVISGRGRGWGEGEVHRLSLSSG